MDSAPTPQPARSTVPSCTQHPRPDTLTVPVLLKPGSPLAQSVQQPSMVYMFQRLSGVSEMPETVRITPFSQTAEGQLHKGYLMPRGIDIKQGHFSFTHLCVQNSSAEHHVAFSALRQGLQICPESY